MKLHEKNAIHTETHVDLGEAKVSQFYMSSFSNQHVVRLQISENKTEKQKLRSFNFYT